jgi:hypothetical protein
MGESPENITARKYCFFLTERISQATSQRKLFSRENDNHVLDLIFYYIKIRSSFIDFEIL